MSSVARIEADTKSIVGLNQLFTETREIEKAKTQLDKEIYAKTPWLGRICGCHCGAAEEERKKLALVIDELDGIHPKLEKKLIYLRGMIIEQAKAWKNNEAFKELASTIDALRCKVLFGEDTDYREFEYQYRNEYTVVSEAFYLLASVLDPALISTVFATIICPFPKNENEEMECSQLLRRNYKNNPTILYANGFYPESPYSKNLKDVGQFAYLLASALNARPVQERNTIVIDIAKELYGLKKQFRQEMKTAEFVKFVHTYKQKVVELLQKAASKTCG